MKPTGREEVREALIDAAARLFAARGPGSVSVREIAAEAGVNHGLVHRHFGAKERLVSAVLDRLSQRLDAALGPDADTLPLAELIERTFATTRAHRLYWQVLARAILDGMEPDTVGAGEAGDDRLRGGASLRAANPGTLQASFPVVTRLVAALQRDKAVPIDARSAAALTVALGLGLLLFEPYLRAATGLDAKRWQALEGSLPTLLRLVVSPTAAGRDAPVGSQG